MRKRVISLLVWMVALTVPTTAGAMKPFVARSEQVSATPVGSLEELNNARLAEMVEGYDNTGVLVTHFVIRYQQEQNNVGGNCTAVANEVVYTYESKPADWFMTRTITTANGDEIFQELSGIAYPIGGPGSDFVIDGEWEITGGSGRFLGAVGLGDADGVLDGATGGMTTVSVLLKGRISTVGSQRRNR